MFLRLFLLLFVSFVSLPVAEVFAAHGVSIDGQLKYPADFERFDYTSSAAQRGGSLVLHDLGSFDKMNPFTLKGTAPFGLDRLVFETLAVSSLDEPFAAYGLIAKDIAVAADHLSVTFTLDERARFSDGSPVTVEDVKFSIETLKSDQVHPFYPYYYQDISEAEILDKQRIRFNFARANRELHMIAAQIPVLSQVFYEKHGFAPASGSEVMAPPLGSGPYVVDTVKQGKSITYRRNPDYWAKDHPTRIGQFNFDRLTVNYYKDQIVSVEAFKAREFDFMLVNIAKQWARDMQGDKFSNGSIVKEVFPHHNNAGIQGFLMNTRRPNFEDRRVRQALGLAMDFEWTNNALFFNQYRRSHSYFSNSPLAASGLPVGLELDYLEPFRSSLPAEVFSTPPTSPETKGRGGLRTNLRQAKQLLEDAGWQVQDGVLRNDQGESFQFEILLVSPSFERVMAPYVKNLEKLGIRADYRTIDPALYADRLQHFDFDMIVQVYGQSQSPGNEQRNYWHSESAATKGSRNLAGINNPAVDAMVERIIYAKTQEELTAACRALDRVLWYGYYLVPNWFMDGHRIAYHNLFARPEQLPLYYDSYQLLMTWWWREAKGD
ncbi:MAG: ABC transporter substrate-binding protein [Desulfobulbaceae bacterium]|uniref:ABC transporter substrate-binding protein n=1 Tax=Candidatus Desulfatifera sulfidica TaxID=2841691 RepID=A0A8J6TD94_9BACT|nr:ABC transporter substrate-binding protein [Candidatus Desulfatifera sulfidica]